MNIVVLAAGKGTRMKSSRPKVVHPVGGLPMISRVVQTAQKLSSQPVVIVVGHQAEEVQSLFLGDQSVQFVEQKEQLGTGHAVQVALDQLDPNKPTLVLYGDVPLVQKASLQPLLEATNSGALALLTLTVQDPSGYGRILRDANGQAIGIVEHKDATLDQLNIHEVNTGILAVPAGFLGAALSQLGNENAQGEYYLTDLVAIAHSQGLAIQTNQPRFAWEVAGVNSRVQQAELERTWQHHLACSLMDEGVHLFDPSRIDVRGQLHCEADVSIDVNCVFEGRVELAQGCSIGPNCVLNNVVLGRGTVVHANSHLVDVVVGEGARIGPFARLRPGSQIGDAVHVGNFVEVKNVEIASHSKVNHLAYLGDARVGERVNVGAGVIICNYDGATKHFTQIEDDAFIGSDSQLVAPVVVGKGATIGAGTTLTRNAPPNSLTVSRPKQVSLSGWQRPKKID